MALTRELHVIRAHHLHYTSLLDDYLKHVEFIAKNPNPAMSKYTEEERTFTQTVMERECDNLAAEIKRLKDNLSMQERRLKNVMGLVSSDIDGAVTTVLMICCRSLALSTSPIVGTCER